MDIEENLKKNLSEIAQEAGNIIADAKNRTIRETTGYQGNCSNYNSNLNRTILGASVGLVAGLFFPLAGAVGIAYGGLKLYHAYKDKKTNVRRII